VSASQSLRACPDVDGSIHTTEELQRFEMRVKRLIYLVWLVRWLGQKREVLEAELKAAIAKGETWLPANYAELGTDLVGFVNCVSNAMLWAFYDEYNRSVHAGPSGEPHDGSERIMSLRSRDTVQCHRDHKPVHVITAVKDIRDRFVHAYLTKYATVGCDLGPAGLLLMPVDVIPAAGGRKVFPMKGRTAEEEEQLFTAIHGAMHSRTAVTAMTFGELLEEVMLDCIRGFDVEVERRRRPK